MTLRFERELEHFLINNSTQWSASQLLPRLENIQETDGLTIGSNKGVEEKFSFLWGRQTVLLFILTPLLDCFFLGSAYWACSLLL